MFFSLARRGALGALVVVTILLLVANLYAHHQGDYLAQDNNFQYGSGFGDTSGLHELFTPARWTLGTATSTSVKWYASHADAKTHTRTESCPCPGPLYEWDKRHASGRNGLTHPTWICGSYSTPTI